MSTPDGAPDREPATATEWIDLARADDVRDVVHRAVACLAQGGVVGLPTDTTYGLAASALQPAAVERLRRIGPTGADLDQAEPPLPLCLRGPDELADWVGGLGREAQRLARRAWPGPLTFVSRAGVGDGLARRLPEAVRSAVVRADRLAVRVPAHDVIREILRLMPGPLVLAEAPTAGAAAAIDAGPLAGLAGLDMVLDDGPTALGEQSTIVEIDAEGWRVARAGALGADDLTRLAGVLIVFICTGNTCRSPMAEALCKVLLAERLGCEVDELEARGFVVRSAGLSAAEGQPAASHAAAIVQARGGSLRAHASRRLEPSLVRHADYLVTMTRDHRDALLYHAPDAAGRTRLLDPEGFDVDDPIGSDRETYRQTAEAIERHLGALLDELAS